MKHHNAKPFGKVFQAHCKLLTWVQAHLYAYKYMYSQRVTTRMHIAHDCAIICTIQQCRISNLQHVQETKKHNILSASVLRIK